MILRHINIIIILMAIVEAVHSKDPDHCLIAIFYVLSIEIVTLLTKRDKSIFIVLITIYIQIVGPIELLLLQIFPEAISGIAYLGYLGSISDIALYWKYFFYSIGFYIMLIFAFEFFKSSQRKGYKITFRNRMIEADEKKKSEFLLWWATIFFATFQYWLRINYNLDIPGAVPEIRFAGIIVYSYSFIKVFLLCKAAFHCNTKAMCVKNSLIIIFYVIVLCLPDILLDRRAPVFYSIIIIFLYFYNTKTESMILFFRRQKLFVISGCISVFIIFSYWTQYVRYRGVYTTISVLYLFSRLTGMVPGLIGIDYLSRGDVYSRFTFVDYFINTFGTRPSSINKIFTYEILNFPTTAIHRSSLPLFVGAFFYEGFLGYIFFAIMFGVIFAICEVLIRKGRESCIKNEKMNSIYVFIGSYMGIYALSLVMGGGAEQMIDLLTIPSMLICYSIIKEQFIKY